MALGARAEQVVGLFYAGGVRLGVIGLVLGLPLSVAASNVVEQGAAASHALVGGVIAFVVLVGASIATLLPAARAARVNPVISLQSE